MDTNTGKKPEKKSFTELSEQFTIQGFIAVSGWALAYALIGWFIPSALKEFGLFEELKWWYYVIYYFTWWIFCFLVFCLIPKLKGEK